MTEYNQTARQLIYLLSCAVNEKTPEIRLEDINFFELFSLAQNHALAAATAIALESAGITEPHFEAARTKAKRKLALFDLERAQIYDRLNNADIWFLPLKGIVMKDFYPAFGMREMTDNDILCDSSKMSEVKAIMEELGYTCESFGQYNHDVYQKPPTLEFEMHHRLFKAAQTPLFDKYYDNVFDRLKRKNGCEYAFTDEDFYVYILAHEYKHFSHNGTGLRSVLDIYVYLKSHPKLDFDYITSELEKLDLTAFEKHSRELALKLFDMETLTEDDLEQLSYYLDSALYGTEAKGEYNTLTRKLDGKDSGRVKARYFLKRIFLSGDELEKNYPFFSKHKWFLPALYIYRPFKGIFTHPRKIFHNIKNVVKYKSPKNRL